MRATFLITIMFSDERYNILDGVDIIFSKEENCYIVEYECNGEYFYIKGKTKLQCFYNYLGILLKERDKEDERH